MVTNPKQKVLLKSCGEYAQKAQKNFIASQNTCLRHRHARSLLFNQVVARTEERRNTTPKTVKQLVFYY